MRLPLCPVSTAQRSGRPCTVVRAGVALPYQNYLTLVALSQSRVTLYTLFNTMDFYNFRKRAALLLTLALTSLYATAQQHDLFQPVTTKAAFTDLVGKELNQYAVLEVDAERYAQLFADRPTDWQLTLPAEPGLTPELTLELRAFSFVRPDAGVRRASTDGLLPMPDLGAHYRGSVVGAAGSKVSLSLLAGEMTATVTYADGRRLTLGRLQNQQDKSPTTAYLLFPDRDLVEQMDLDCATPDPGVGYSAKELSYDFDDKSSAGCVDIFFEIDYDIYVDKGNVTAAVQHLAANFNEVAVLYDEIGVNVRISEFFVWDQPSPYFGGSSSAMLTQFQANRTFFNGDLAQLVSYQASGGIAVIDGLCFPANSARMSFSSIASDFAAVPIYSWSTMVIAHELGHQLGSQHTHACVWNGNDTAIDGCAGNTTGNCPLPPFPAAGGTLMSYCHLRPVGINFQLGFGSQPGAVIANRVAAAQGCVQATCDVSPPDTGDDDSDDDNGGGGDDDNDDDNDNDDNGGGGPTVCEGEAVYVNLTLDDFGMETTWTLRTESGALLASGGPYPKKQAGRVVRDTVCVPDGCFLFQINDSDGDGICCEYGQGRYLLRDANGHLLAQGQSFDTLDLVDFCLPYVVDDEDDDDDEPASDDCVAFDFNQQPIVTYGANQDFGTGAVQDNGRTAFLQNNAWKAIELNYNVTEDTWVSFWFRSTKRGEVHGIGFDDNSVLSAELTFRLYGTQAWGIGDFANYSGGGQWQYYQIPVGQFYTLQSAYLFFTADHDVGSRDGNSYFRDVTVTEGAPCPPAQSLTAGEIVAPHDGARVMPNPATHELTVTLPATVTGPTAYRVVDLAGRTVLSGEAASASFVVPVAELPNGSYLLRYDGAAGSGSRRFVVAH